MDISHTRTSFNVAVRGSVDGSAAQLPRNYVSQASSDENTSSEEGGIPRRTTTEVFRDVALKLNSNIKYLPRFVQSSQHSQTRNAIRGEECAIAWDEVNDDSAIKLECGHVFKREKIADWVSRDKDASCPMDRALIKPEQKADIAELSPEHRAAILANLNEQNASTSVDELASDGSLRSTVQEIENPQPQNARPRNRILTFIQNLCR